MIPPWNEQAIFLRGGGGLALFLAALICYQTGIGCSCTQEGRGLKKDKAAYVGEGGREPLLEEDFLAYRKGENATRLLLQRCA